MALIDVQIIKNTGRTEILLKLEVHTLYVGLAMTAIAELVGKYDLENKGGEK